MKNSYNYFSKEAIKWEADNYSELRTFQKTKNIVILFAFASLIVPFLLFITVSEDTNILGFNLEGPGMSNTDVNVIMFMTFLLLTGFFSLFVYLNYRWAVLAFGVWQVQLTANDWTKVFEESTGDILWVSIYTVLRVVLLYLLYRAWLVIDSKAS